MLLRAKIENSARNATNNTELYVRLLCASAVLSTKASIKYPSFSAEYDNAVSTFTVWINHFS